MSWLDNMRGKKRPSDAPAPEEETPNAGRTVVRATGAPAPTIIKGSTRFKPGDEVGGNLQIKRLLGRGGMGEVYLARQTQWDVDIAVKIPTEQILADPVNRHRIAREAEAWADLGLHPHIAYCHYAQVLDELLLLVIEYVDGGSLREWIAEGRCADLKTGLNLAIQFCHGLEHAHSRGLIHRDIKPENILLTKDGLLKITDFGIVRKALAGIDGAESVGAVPMAVAPGMTMVAIGTDDYMAPEQWGQQQAIDQRADIFALGVCLYEMLCGRRPYVTKTVGPRQEAPEPGILRGDNGLSPQMCSLMKRCVDWDRENRPAGAEQVLAELCAVYEEAFGEASLHAELPGISALADDLNNRALSYLALGRAEDAERAWQAALEADPLHAESVYNYGMQRWRKAKTTDAELMRTMREVIRGDPQSWLPRYLLAQVHLERGDCEGAREELGGIGEDDVIRDDVTTALRAVNRLSAPSRLARTLEANDGAVYWVWLSADGQCALSSGADTLKRWDVASGRCLHTFDRRGVFCASPDGKYALFGSEDGTVQLWDVSSGRYVRTFEGHADMLVFVCLSADGRYAISGSRDKILKLWDVASGRCLRTFEESTNWGLPVCLSADGHYAVLGSEDDTGGATARAGVGWGNTLKLWEVTSGSCLRTFEGHTDSVMSVCLSADGRFALSGGNDKTLKLWDVASGRCLRTFEGDIEQVASVCLSADGCSALSGGYDHTLKLWDVASGRCLRTFQGHSNWVESVCLSAGGHFALSGSYDGTLKLWEVGAFDFTSRLRLGTGLGSAEVMVAATRYQKAVSGARHALIAGGALTACRLLRMARQQVGHRRAASGILEWVKLYDQLNKRGLADCWPQWTSEGYAETVCVSPDGKYVLSGNNDDILKLWEVASCRCLRTFEGRTPACLSADGQQFVLSGGGDNTLKLWEVTSGRCLRTFEWQSGALLTNLFTTGRLCSVCLSADGKYAISGSKKDVRLLSTDGQFARWGSEKMLKLWEVTSGRCLRTFEGHPDSLCLSADGQFALSSSDDTLKLWEVASGHCLRTFEGHTEWVSSVCLSTSGRYALSGSSDKTLKLWDVASGRCLRTFQGHTELVSSVCLSTDGQFAFSGSWDKTLKVWEVANGRCLRTLEGRTGRVHSVCLSADGKYAFSCGDVNITAWLLDWDLEENEPADWEEGARPYLDVFLRAHRPYAAKMPTDRQPTEEEVRRALTRHGRPVWSETEFQGFLHTLGCAGFGWLRPVGVRRELELMTAASHWEKGCDELAG